MSAGRERAHARRPAARRSVGVTYGSIELVLYMPHAPFFALVVAMVAFLYLWIVQMRVIGLLYYTQRAELSWLEA